MSETEDPYNIMLFSKMYYLKVFDHYKMEITVN